MEKMASKAKLSLSQLLFRRANNNSNSNHEGQAHKQENGNSHKYTGKLSHSVSNGSGFKAERHRRMSGGSGGGTVSAGRQFFYESGQVPETQKAPSMENQQFQQQTPQQKVQQQLQGILKKPTGEGGGLTRTHRSSLQRSKSNPNPSNNPLKEVSWSCPTLEKRREVILNYFERIILENKQEQNGHKQTTKPNIPCENGSGEPIYEEILEVTTQPPPQFQNAPDNNNKTGSLKPKLGPKKVRMNIPQDYHHHRNGNGGQPIYDKVLCRSHSMLESSTSSSSSGFYDVAPSTVASLSSSSSHHSLYENFRPSSYYATSTSSASSTDGDYGVVGGGNGYSSNGKTGTTTRIAGRSHSFHDNYRNSGHYNIQPPTPLSVDTDQLYAKVCKRKKLRMVNNDNGDKPQSIHRPPLSSNTSNHSKPGCNDHQHNRNYNHRNESELCVQVSCGNVVTMIPVMMPSSSVASSSSFSTSCLSLSSASDNNTDDNMTITTSISSINSRNHSSAANHNGLFHYEAEKIIPDKTIAYINCKSSEPGDNCPPSSAAARNRNNLSVIHLLAAYDPAKEIEEFIPTTPPTFSAAIIDSTECAPKSISVPVRAGFSSGCNTKNGNTQEKKDAELSSSARQHVMLTNCSFGYDNDAFQDDEENGGGTDADDEDNNHHKNLLRSSSSINGATASSAPTISTSKDNHISSAASSSAGTNSGADDDGCGSSATSDTDTDEDEHHAQKYSFTNSNNRGHGRGILKTHNHNRVKRITFQDDVVTTPVNTSQKIATATTQDLLLLTTSEESEVEEELCEHKSLLEMNRTENILDESSGENGGKYSLIDDEDRGFDSFMEESENSGESKGDSPSSFSSDNLRNQRTFAQMTQNVPQEQLKKKAASVLDLINSEISDLHMRELELKKIHTSQKSSGGDSGKEKDDHELMNEGSGEEFEEGSSGEDDFSDSAIEYDGFTTNGSHSSGQVSPSENLNEMINQHQQQIEEEEPRDHDENADDEEDEEEQDVVDHKRGIKEVKVRPLEEEEDRSIKFVPSDETPIEREIRLTREREEEFRRNNHSYLAICPPAPSAVQKPTTGSSSMMKPRDVSSRPETQSKPEMPLIPSAPSKDIQLEMATARFKKEIEESMEREKELIRETRQKKLSETEESQDVAPVKEDGDQNVAQEPSTPVAPTPPQEQPEKPLPPTEPTVTPTTTPAAENQSQLRKPTVSKLSIAKLPAARFFAPPAFNANKPSRITPVVSPIISKSSWAYPSSATSNSNAALGSPLPVGMSRPSFTSFEKYILQTSKNYMANKQTPVTTPNEGETETATEGVKDPGVVNKNLQFSSIPEDPLRIIQKPNSVDESNENGSNELEEEKPKRRYIPAQDKIHQEIQELAMREKELNVTRGKWKSTLDLPEALKEAEEEKEPLRRTTSTTQSSLSLNTAASREIELVPKVDNDNSDAESDKLNFTNVTSEDVRQVTRVKAPARRRHSLLINQWEERIRQQQQQNSKK